VTRRTRKVAVFSRVGKADAVPVKDVVRDHPGCNHRRSEYQQPSRHGPM
jgi:hypothetical protein